MRSSTGRLIVLACAVAWLAVPVRAAEPGQWEGYVEIRKYTGTTRPVQHEDYDPDKHSEKEARLQRDWKERHVVGEKPGAPSNLWTDNRIALVIHGINNKLTNLSPLAYYLTELKIYKEVWGVNYHSQAPITDNGHLLAEFIKEHRAAHLDVFGHSMGGLVARWAMEKEGAGPYVNRLFTLGTPHNGVPISLAELKIMRKEPTNKLNGPGIEDLVAGHHYLARSTFLSELNASGGSPATDYYVFAGNNWRGYAVVGPLCYARYDGDDDNMDGIVPVDSAKYSGLASKCRRLIAPTETYYLAHDEIRGRYEPDGTFNLDNDGGSMKRPLGAWRSPAPLPFRDYVLRPVLGAAGPDWREHTKPSEVVRAVVEDVKEAKDRTGEADVVFCIDVTSSMEDDIDEVKHRAQEMIEKLHELIPSLRLALVTYRDYDDGASHLDPADYVPLTDRSEQVLSRIQSIAVRGGAFDIPEDVIDGLMKSLQVKWRDNVGKFVILMGDAPAKQPDHNGRSYADVAKLAAEIDPVHVYGIVSGGSEAAATDFRKVAGATGGTVAMIRDAAELPDAIVSTLRVAVKEHAREVYGGASDGSADLQTPLLVGAVAGIVLLGALCVVVAIRQRNSGDEPVASGSVVGWLQVYEPGHPPRNCPVRSGTLRVGRDPSNDLVVLDPKVSAFHAQLHTRATATEVIDVGSTNGTSVNGGPKAQCSLSDGDAVEIGDTTIYYFGPPQ